MDTVSYNRYSRYLHWLIACLILFMVFLGWRLDPHDPHVVKLAFWHKSVGISILLLSFVRIGFRLAYKAPPEPPMPKWQLLAAQALHLGFYAVMIGMPLTGWLMVSTSAREIPFFGLFGWPHLPVPQTKDMHEVFENLHGLIAKLLIYGMIPLHVLAALKHQFVDKDTVVEHMVPGLKPEPVLNYRWLLPIGVVALAIGGAELIYRGAPDKAVEATPPSPDVASSASATADMEAVATESVVLSKQTGISVEPATVPQWMIDKAATSIKFATTFQGEAINGSFGAFDAVIAFDPAQLDKSHVKVTIDLASVNSGDGDRDSTLKSDSFFNIATTPKAVFEARSFTKKDATHFIAHGKLTMHGTTRAFELPFTLKIKGDIHNNADATMSATATLDRTAFGVGSGDYKGTDAIPANVTVTIALQASHID